MNSTYNNIFIIFIIYSNSNDFRKSKFKTNCINKKIVS